MDRSFNARIATAEDVAVVQALATADTSLLGRLFSGVNYAKEVECALLSVVVERNGAVVGFICVNDRLAGVGTNFDAVVSDIRKALASSTIVTVRSPMCWRRVRAVATRVWTTAARPARFQCADWQYGPRSHAAC